MKQKSSRTIQDKLRDEYDFRSLRIVARGPGRKTPMKAISEEHEMMNSPDFRKSIRESRRQIKQGKAYRLDSKTGKFKKV